MKIKLIVDWIRDFFALFYPNNCVVCGKSLFKHEYVICLKCKIHLPLTRYAGYVDNPVAKVFWGRADLKYCFTWLHYKKGNSAQILIHSLKYKNREDVGLFLGQEFGKALDKVIPTLSFDIILPVPLHPSKQRLRGYNQSSVIASGIGKMLDIPVNNKILVRTKKTATQTKKTRFNRWENVDGIFNVVDKNVLKDKHVVLIDDVITTGSTIEACYEALNQCNGVKISTLAIGSSL